MIAETWQNHGTVPIVAQGGFLKIHLLNADIPHECVRDSLTT